MRAHLAIATGLVIGLGLAAPVWAQELPDRRGTFEFGGYALLVRHSADQDLGGEQGLGLRAGVLLSRRWGLELDASSAWVRDRRTDSLANVMPVALRLAYARPVRPERDVVLVASLGAVAADDGRRYAVGGSALAGLKLGFTDWSALRADAIADYVPRGATSTLGIRIGVSLFRTPLTRRRASTLVSRGGDVAPAMTDREWVDAVLAPAPRDSAPLEITVPFERGSASIAASGAFVLRRMLPRVVAWPEAIVVVAGQPSGVPECDATLARARAVAMRAWLISHGIVPARISILSSAPEAYRAGARAFRLVATSEWPSCPLPK